MSNEEFMSNIDSATADEIISFINRTKKVESSTIDFWFDKWIFHIKYWSRGLTDLCIYRSVDPKYAARCLAEELFRYGILKT